VQQQQQQQQEEGATGLRQHMLLPCPTDLTVPCPVVVAVQRATIVVHEDKVLVKTEIVKAIITPDKAVLIKGRCVYTCVAWLCATHGAGWLRD
jgi:hypothetical protein